MRAYNKHKVDLFFGLKIHTVITDALAEPTKKEAYHVALLERATFIKSHTHIIQ